jgi:hypothetical protein
MRHVWVFVGIMKEREQLEDVSIDGKILKFIYMKKIEGVKRIYLAQDRDGCWEFID